MTRTVRIGCVAAAVAFAPGCTEGRSAGPAVVSDSAGIRVIAFRDGIFDTGTVWTVDSVPEVVIGVAEGETSYELHDVLGAARLGTGEVVVADRGRQELLAFSADGAFLSSLGSAGEGPGEFSTIGSLQLIPPDTLLVFDPDLRRANAFTLAEGFVGSVVVQTGGYAGPGTARRTDGTFILALVGSEVWNRIESNGIRPGTTARNSAHFATYDAAGELIDTIANLPGYEEAVVERDGSISTMYAPWGRNISWGLLPSDLMVTGTQEAGEVVLLDRDGDLHTIIRWPAGDLAIAQRHVDQFHDVMFQRIDDPGERRAAIDRLGELPLPPTRAAYGEILTDARGLIWISNAHLPLRHAREWRVIDSESATVARVTLPPAFELLWVGERHVVGRTTDELGVQRVEVRGLTRSD